MMNFLKTALYTNQLFFLPLFLLGITGLFLGDILYIPLHADNPFWLNVFFINYSFMGDGLFAMGLVIFCFFFLREKRTSLLFLFAFLFSEGLVQLIKNFFSNGRLDLFFEKGQYLYFTDEADLINFNSFPSGHTAVAFAIATVVILRMKNKKWIMPVFGAAFLLGISRMYLAQHSMPELVAGAFIGSTAALFVFCLAENARTIKYWFKKLHRFETNPSTPNIHSSPLSPEGGT